MIREIRADNASAMTLDGTRTFVVGDRQIAIIDPGPADARHITAILDAVGQGTRPLAVTILLTHMHPDHADGAGTLATRVSADVRAIALDTLSAGDVISTDAGPLMTVASPGHTPDHACFHATKTGAVFCGDLMMGGLDTALVAPPEGDLTHYLASLERVRALGPTVIHPAHGPSFDDARAAIDRYVAHRMHRIDQVTAALDDRSRSRREIAETVYGGEIPDELREVAVAAVVAYLDYLEQQGRAIRDATGWRAWGAGHIIA